MRKAASKKTVGGAGKHVNKRIQIVTTGSEQLERWTRAAKTYKLTLSEWARRVLDDAAAFIK